MSYNDEGRPASHKRTETCGQCRDKVDSIFWLSPIRTSVCYKCRETYESAHPDWRIDEARKNLAKAHEAVKYAEEDLAELLAEKS